MLKIAHIYYLTSIAQLGSLLKVSQGCNQGVGWVCFHLEHSLLPTPVTWLVEFRFPAFYPFLDPYEDGLKPSFLQATSLNR